MFHLMYQPEPKAALQGELNTGWEGCVVGGKGADGQGLCRAIGGGSGICEAVEETRAVLAFLT